MKKVSLTGIKPTGTPHLGNYLGAIRPALELSKTYDTVYFIADYHALTTVQNGAEMRANIYKIAATWLALGLNPEEGLFYKQSDIPEIFELSWALSCFTPKGFMNRAHAYKAKVEANTAAGEDADANVNMGLYCYPCLMDADILMFNADIVPVGKDQKQHLEVTRDLAQKFNNAYGEIFKMPDAYIPETVATIPGTDGQKMSKSYHNTIELFEDAKSIKKKVMAIVTDSKTMEEPKEPEGNSIYELYKLFATPDEVAEMAKNFRAGNYGYGHAKKALLEAYHRLFDPFRARREELAKDPDALEDILRAGAAKARAAAAPTMEKVRAAVGL